ncbi:MAG TPA: hypothetical protein VJO12_03515 [Stellaceae bacterium]|nr:hypothetical protein [Stellaceae bacterium]
MIADLMRGTGRFNLAQGAIATMQAIGASLSGLFAGEIVDHLGYAPPSSRWAPPRCSRSSCSRRACPRPRRATSGTPRFCGCRDAAGAPMWRPLIDADPCRE